MCRSNWRNCLYGIVSAPLSGPELELSWQFVSSNPGQILNRLPQRSCHSAMPMTQWLFLELSSKTLDGKRRVPSWHRAPMNLNMERSLEGLIYTDTYCCRCSWQARVCTKRNATCIPGIWFWWVIHHLLKQVARFMGQCGQIRGTTYPRCSWFFPPLNSWYSPGKRQAMAGRDWFCPGRRWW